VTAITGLPSNPNFLSPINFKFQLKRAPNLNFFIQKANIPGLSLPRVEVPNPILAYPFPGDHLSYDEFQVTFKVDENLQNYLEIHNWIRSLGRLNPSDYATIANNPSYTGTGIRSDISLQVLNSVRQPNFEIVFKEAFPIVLSSVEFDVTMEDVNFIEASATFIYLNYEITKTS
jgi:hypothetical protein